MNGNKQKKGPRYSKLELLFQTILTLTIIFGLYYFLFEFDTNSHIKSRFRHKTKNNKNGGKSEHWHNQRKN